MTTVNANTAIYDKAVDRAAMIRLYERRVNSKIELVIDGHVVRLDDLIKKANLSPLGAKKLKEDIALELLRTHRETYNLSKRSLMDLVNDQISYAYQNVESAMSQIWSSSRPMDRVADNIVLETPLQEYNSSEWLG
jgi:hypothetical protein